MSDWKFLAITLSHSLAGGMRPVSITSLLVVCLLASYVGADEGDKVLFSGLAQTFKGRMSTFGGPNDRGVSPSEGAAIHVHV